MSKQQSSKMKYDYPEVVRGLFMEVQRASEGYQTIIVSKKVQSKMDELGEVTKKILRNPQGKAEELVNLKMVSKDYVAYAHVNGDVNVFGAIRSNGDQLLWPLFTLNENGSTLVDSVQKVDQLAKTKEIKISESIEAMKRLVKTYTEISEKKILKVLKPQTNLYAHRQNVSEIKFDGEKSNFKF